MLKWLKSLFSAPQPAGPPQVLRAFAPDKPTITQSGIRAEQGAWRIDATEKQTIRLFEVESPAVEQCLLTYRAELKAEALKGRAFLEMWCRLPGRGEFLHHEPRDTGASQAGPRARGQWVVQDHETKGSQPCWTPRSNLP